MYDYSYSTTNYSGGEAIFSGVWILFWLAFAVLSIIGLWKVFTKANQAGWKALIPIYNAYIMLKIVGRPGWWLLLFFIPLVNIVISLLVSIDLAKSFGKSTTFGVVGLWLFSPIGFLLLGFGEANYVGPPAQAKAV